MYQTILVPLDGSRRAEAILAHVEQLARHSGGRIVLTAVVEPTTRVAAGQSLPLDLEAVEREAAQMDHYLAGKQGEFRAKGIDARYVVEHGPVVETIIDVAQREQADLIAMASHGRGGLARVFYGSVAAGVLQRVDRPLLLIRARYAG